MRTIHRALWFVLTATVWTSSANAEELAVARENNVNVRGQPSFVGEVITRLKKGDPVTVLEEITLDKSKEGEPGKWARILMPTNVNVWAYSLFIDPVNKSVIAKRLNMRTGPSENHSVVGRLDQGTVVTEISTKGDWMEIATPTNAYAFVAADLLEKQPATSAPTEPTLGAPIIAPAVTLSPAPTGKPPKETFSVLATPPVALLTPAQPLEAPPASLIEAKPAVPTPTLATPTQTPAVDTAKSDNTLEILTTSAVKRPILLTPKPDSLTVVPTVVPETQPQPEPEAVPPPTRRIVRREGILSGSISIQAPSHYQLSDLQTRQAINYLHTTSTNLPLKQLKGRKVIVIGEESVDRRWPKTPVLEIDIIELLP